MIAKLIRLDNLVGLAVMAAHYAYRVFNGNLGAINIRKPHKELNAPLLSPIGAFLCEMPCPGNGQVGAWWERDYHVPRFSQQRYNVLLQMPFRVSTAALLYVTGICFMPQPPQFFRHRLGFLTGNQYPHHSPSCFSPIP
jgi:hypothetical protein